MPSVIGEFDAKLSQLEADWESYKGDTSIYDEAAMFSPGCAIESYAVR